MNKQAEFLKLINHHQGILYKVSKMYMDTEEDQEDLRQEIVFQLWKSYDKFNGKSQFSSWMYRVAINTAITFFKNDQKRIDTKTLDDDLKVQTDELELVEETQLAHFYSAVKSLNKIEKAIILYFIEGLSHKDIANNLGLTPVNARVKLNRTKTKLKSIIKKQGYEF